MSRIIRKIIEIDEELCDGCGECVPSCAEGAIQIINGKAKLVAEKYCDGLGACLGNCPKGAIKIVEREAEAFDKKAVEKLLKQKEKPSLACGCPGEMLKSFEPRPNMNASNKEKTPSALSHWPIQIKLVPPEAPFLKKASLLVAADCVGFSYPDFHRDFLPGKILMIGCPKFDDIDDYVARFAAIFSKNEIKDLTLAIMEVPCCRGLTMIIKKARELVGIKGPFKVIVVSLDGKIVSEENWT